MPSLFQLRSRQKAMAPELSAQKAPMRDIHAGLPHLQVRLDHRFRQAGALQFLFAFMRLFGMSTEERD